MFEKYVPETLLKEFCDFVGISDLRSSRYSGENYRGIWKESIVIFSTFRPGWLEVNCTRATLSDEFDAMLKKFHSLLDDAPPEKNPGN